MPCTISKLNLLLRNTSGTHQHFKIISTMLKESPQHLKTSFEGRKQPKLPSRLGHLKVFQLTKIVSSFKRTASSFFFERNIIWLNFSFLFEVYLNWYRSEKRSRGFTRRELSAGVKLHT